MRREGEWAGGPRDGTSIAFAAADGPLSLSCSVITFFQQVGFASLESGSVRAKNTRNVLLKVCGRVERRSFFFFLQPSLPTHPSTQTLIDKVVSGVVYWAIGFAFAYGDTAGGVIGRSGFFLAHATPEALALWFSSWTFLITATTIVSGCLAERAAFGAYLAYTPVVSGLAFPLAVHWAFHGWLSDAPCAYIDFAGGSTVHLLGGTAGLAAALLVGPRLGRFDDGGGGSSSGGRVAAAARL